MKTLFATALLVAASLATTASFAEGNDLQGRAFSSNAYVSTNNHNRLNVIVVKQDTAPVTMRLVNAYGREVYTTQLTETALKPLDISNLEAGQYTVVVTSGSVTNTSAFEVK